MSSLEPKLLCWLLARSRSPLVSLLVGWLCNCVTEEASKLESVTLGFIFEAGVISYDIEQKKVSCHFGPSPAAGRQPFKCAHPRLAIHWLLKMFKKCGCDLTLGSLFYLFRAFLVPIVMILKR